MEDYKLWCTYHRVDIPGEYNLYETDNFKLFYNDNFNLEEDNINYLHDYLCDIVTYYYVWKNNLKSDIVGFCQYSKHFNHIDYEKLNKFGFYAYSYQYDIDNNNINKLCKNNEYLNRNFVFYLKSKYNINLFQYMNEHNCIFHTCHNMYFFKWNIFCDVCDFIFGYLDYIFPNEKWKIKSNIDFIMRMNGTDKNELCGSISWFPKGLSIFFEWSIGIYLGIKYNLNHDFIYDKSKNTNNYVIICSDEITEQNEQQFESWVKKNIKSGITNYIIKSNIKDIKKKYTFGISVLLNMYVYNLIVCDDHNIAEYENNFINDNYKIIYMDLNEYIHCDSSIEFHNGNYYIEKIS